jgi:hypothetical protein
MTGLVEVVDFADFEEFRNQFSFGNAAEKSLATI